MSYDDLDLNDQAPSEEPNDEGHVPRLELEFRGESGWVEFRSIGDLSGRHLEELRLAAGREGSRGQAANTLYAKAMEMLVERWEIPTRPNLPTPRGPQGHRNLQQVPLIPLKHIERHIMKYLDPWISERPDGEAFSRPAHD